MGLFYPFLENKVELIGVEPGAWGLSTAKHGASLARGTVGVLHGSKSLLLQNEDGQILATHSLAAGLDYPGVGPEHAYLKETGRARYETVTDKEALEAFEALSRLEGIIPALESAHAVAYVKKIAPKLARDEIMVINLSGRGDKDVEQASSIISHPEGR